MSESAESSAPPAESSSPPGSPGLLLISVFLVATCGLVYELIAGALASYLLGDSVLQFSTIIGDYLFAMGVGSYLSQYVGRRRPEVAFVRLQSSIALIGGCSAAVMHIAYSYSGGFRLVLYLLVFLVGLLVGVEIPLLMNILKRNYGFRELVSHVLALDYLGALLASILFPLVLIPQLGLIRTSFACGLINVAVAWVFLRTFNIAFMSLVIESVIVALVLGAGLIFSDRLTSWAEEGLYPDPIVLSKTTPYQRIIVTRRHDEMRLYLNGNLQFSSEDEYRYHECLVDPPLASVPKARNVLVLGGGDGLAAREILKFPEVESVTLVDLDPAMTGLFRDHPALSRLNAHSLRDPKLHVINTDAFVWVRTAPAQRFDAIVVDFPDPSNYSVGKLYTSAFYASLTSRLGKGGAISVQCTSPLFARRSYWCIVETMKAAGWQVRPYHVYVPSFGEWGYVLAGREAAPQPQVARLPRELKFLSASDLPNLFVFPQDMAALKMPINRIFDQALVRFYEQDWRNIVE